MLRESASSTTRAVDRLVVLLGCRSIAIIITLMVLEVRLPTLPEHASDAEVLRALLAIWPKYLAVVLSYPGDRPVLDAAPPALQLGAPRRSPRSSGSTCVYLLVLACVPFATALTAEHPGRTSAIVYAGVLGVGAR